MINASGELRPRPVKHGAQRTDVVLAALEEANDVCVFFYGAAEAIVMRADNFFHGAFDC